MKKAFTLVEVMIVVSIVVLLAAIAIPNLLRARLNANEAAAIASLRMISNGCESFRAAQTPPTYPPNGLGDLIPPTSVPPYIDTNLASGSKQGYTFNYQFLNANQYNCIANPINPGFSGTRVLFVDESGVIRLNNAAGAPIE